MDGSGPRSLCPSAPLRRGSLLLGVVEAEGRVAILPEPITVTEGFAERAREGRRPEARFRFASPCLREGCSRWGGSCGVAQLAVGSVAPEAALPACAIRARCQWFAEHEEAACAACRYVITDRERQAV